jgi:hypothetical protein
MELKYKIAAILLSEDRVIIECPFCGRSLVSAPYRSITRLLNDVGRLKGKVCRYCGGVALLKFSLEVREKIRAKIVAPDTPSTS